MRKFKPQFTKRNGLVGKGVALEIARLYNADEGAWTHCHNASLMPRAEGSVARLRRIQAAFLHLRRQPENAPETITGPARVCALSFDICTGRPDLICFKLHAIPERAKRETLKRALCPHNHSLKKVLEPLAGHKARRRLMLQLGDPIPAAAFHLELSQLYARLDAGVSLMALLVEDALAEGVLPGGTLDTMFPPGAG